MLSGLRRGENGDGVYASVGDGYGEGAREDGVCSCDGGYMKEIRGGGRECREEGVAGSGREGKMNEGWGKWDWVPGDDVIVLDGLESGGRARSVTVVPGVDVANVVLDIPAAVRFVVMEALAIGAGR